MRGSKRKISYVDKDKEIYKAFAWLIKCNYKYPKISDLLHFLNVDKISKKYRESPNSFSSYLKLLIFMDLKKLGQLNAERYLKKHRRERKKLGLKRTPDQSSISKFMTNHLTDETKKKLSYMSDKIIEISKESTIELDFYQKKKKTKKIDREKRSNTPIIEKICKKIFKKVKPFFPIYLKYNAIYEKEDYLELLLHMSKENDFAENASGTLREEMKKNRVFCPYCNRLLYPLSDFSVLEKDENYWICKYCGYDKRISPDADTHFHHIKKIALELIQSGFSRLNEEILNDAMKSQSLDRSKKVEFTISCLAATDTTVWKTYPNLRKPDKNNRYIKGGKPDKKDFWGYEFISLDIVEHGKRFTIKTLPVYPGENIREKAKQLLIYAKEQGIFIKNLFADKGFYNNNFRKMLDIIKVKYVIPVKRNEEIKTLLKKTSVPLCNPDYRHGKQETLFNMIIVKGRSSWRYHEDIKFAFATNNAINEDADIEKIASLYPKRWGIETAFRIKKEDYLPKTTSKDPKVRLFYFLYSVFMYNLWFLADILTWIEIHKKVGNYRILKSKFFRCIFKKVLSEPG